MTILGFFRRQMAACLPPLILIAVIIAFVYAFSANAQGYRARDFDSQQIMQSQIASGVDMNQPHYQQPIFQPGPMAMPQSTRVGPSQYDLWVGPVNYTRATDFVDYFIQPDLKLGVTYNYKFNFTLLARDKRADQQPVPNGWYQLSMAVVMVENKDSRYIDQIQTSAQTSYDRYVTSERTWVKVTGGRLYQPISLHFTNLSATTVMNHLYIEFIPLRMDCPGTDAKGQPTTVDCIHETANGEPDPLNSRLEPRPGYKPYLMEMAFLPYASSGAGGGTPDKAPKAPQFQELKSTPETLGEFIVKAKASRMQERKTKTFSPEEFAKINNLNLLSVYDPLVTESVGSWLKTESAEAAITHLLDSDGIGALKLSDRTSNLMKGLCKLLWTTGPIYQQALQSPRGMATNPRVAEMQNNLQSCALDPSAYVRLASVTHVFAFDAKKVSSPTQQPMKYSMQTNYLVSRSHSNEQSMGISPGQIAFKVLDAFGFGLAGGNYQVSTTNSFAQSESTSASNSLPLDFNVIDMRLPLTKYQRCLEVQPVYYGTQWNNRGLYICEDLKTNPIVANETYVHTFVHVGDTASLDPYSASAQPINLALRGDREITAFYYHSRKGMRADHDNKIQPFDMLSGTVSYLTGNSMNDGRTIVRPMLFQHERVTSFVERVFGYYPERFMQDE